ncbi:hypothetical protein D3C76_944380 [compost metagenome]
MKTTIKLYIHQLPGKEQRAEVCDMSGFEWYGALLGIREVEVDFEPFDVDPVVAMIDSLERQIAQKRANCTRDCNLLLEKISQLKCLEHKPERAP